MSVMSQQVRVSITTIIVNVAVRSAVYLTPLCLCFYLYLFLSIHPLSSAAWGSVSFVLVKILIIIYNTPTNR